MMNTVIRCEFYIEDVEFDDIYKYVAHFENFKELKQFLWENRKVGNYILPLRLKAVAYDEKYFDLCLADVVEY